MSESTLEHKPQNEVKGRGGFGSSIGSFYKFMFGSKKKEEASHKRTTQSRSGGLRSAILSHRQDNYKEQTLEEGAQDDLHNLMGLSRAQIGDEKENRGKKAGFFGKLGFYFGAKKEERLNDMDFMKTIYMKSPKANIGKDDYFDVSSKENWLNFSPLNKPVKVSDLDFVIRYDADKDSRSTVFKVGSVARAKLFPDTELTAKGVVFNEDASKLTLENVNVTSKFTRQGFRGKDHIYVESLPLKVTASGVEVAQTKYFGLMRDLKINSDNDYLVGADYQLPKKVKTEYTFDSKNPFRFSKATFKSSFNFKAKHQENKAQKLDAERTSLTMEQSIQQEENQDEKLVSSIGATYSIGDSIFNKLFEFEETSVSDQENPNVFQFKMTDFKLKKLVSKGSTDSPILEVIREKSGAITYSMTFDALRYFDEKKKTSVDLEKARFKLKGANPDAPNLSIEHGTVNVGDVETIASRSIGEGFVFDADNLYLNLKNYDFSIGKAELASFNVQKDFCESFQFNDTSKKLSVKNLSVSNQGVTFEEISFKGQSSEAVLQDDDAKGLKFESLDVVLKKQNDLELDASTSNIKYTYGEDYGFEGESFRLKLQTANKFLDTSFTNLSGSFKLFDIPKIAYGHLNIGEKFMLTLENASIRFKHDWAGNDAETDSDLNKSGMDLKFNPFNFLDVKGFGVKFANILISKDKKEFYGLGITLPVVQLNLFDIFALDWDLEKGEAEGKASYRFPSGEEEERVKSLLTSSEGQSDFDINDKNRIFGIGIPIPIMPGVDAEIGLEAGATFGVDGLVKANKAVNGWQIAKAGIASAIELGAKLSAGIGLGASAIASVILEGYGLAVAKFTGKAVAEGGFVFRRSPFGLVPDTGSTLTLTGSAGLTASLGMAVKAQAFRIFQKTLYKKQSRPFDIGTLKAEGVWSTKSEGGSNKFDFSQMSRKNFTKSGLAFSEDVTEYDNTKDFYTELLNKGDESGVEFVIDGESNDVFIKLKGKSKAVEDEYCLRIERLKEDIKKYADKVRKHRKESRPKIDNAFEHWRKQDERRRHHESTRAIYDYYKSRKSSIDRGTLLTSRSHTNRDIIGSLSHLSLDQLKISINALFNVSTKWLVGDSEYKTAISNYEKAEERIKKGENIDLAPLKLNMIHAAARASKNKSSQKQDFSSDASMVYDKSDVKSIFSSATYKGAKQMLKDQGTDSPTAMQITEHVDKHAENRIKYYHGVLDKINEESDYLEHQEKFAQNELTMSKQILEAIDTFQPGSQEGTSIQLFGASQGNTYAMSMKMALMRSIKERYNFALDQPVNTLAGLTRQETQFGENVDHYNVVMQSLDGQISEEETLRLMDEQNLLREKEEESEPVESRK